MPEDISQSTMKYDNLEGSSLYRNILVALDGSSCSNLAVEPAVALACDNARLIGCHVYAARMHRARFGDMEPGLPENYRGEEMARLRSTHEGLITEGLQMISDHYLRPLEKRALEKGLEYEGLTPEGRNYVRILSLASDKDADLVILGATGQGRENDLGSTAESVLLCSQGRDMLFMRRAWSFEDRPIVVGVDGSENSYAALRRAVEISRSVRAEVKAVSVYDPFFHTEIFRHISASMPEKAKKHLDLASQEMLHDEIIDEGLAKLYSQGLEKGVLLARSMGVEIKPEVLTGKVSSQIMNYASHCKSGLVVLGRWGLHREKESLLGSNALKAARLSDTNVLIVSP